MAKRGRKAKNRVTIQLVIDGVAYVDTMVYDSPEQLVNALHATIPNINKLLVPDAPEVIEVVSEGSDAHSG
jgi:hypothetical protein